MGFSRKLFSTSNPTPEGFFLDTTCGFQPTAFFDLQSNTQRFLFGLLVGLANCFFRLPIQHPKVAFWTLLVGFSQLHFLTCNPTPEGCFLDTTCCFYPTAFFDLQSNTRRLLFGHYLWVSANCFFRPPVQHRRLLFGHYLWVLGNCLLLPPIQHPTVSLWTLLVGFSQLLFLLTCNPTPEGCFLDTTCGF